MSTLRELPLFPLSTVLFPGMVLPLHIFEDRYKLMIRRCISKDEPFGVVLIQEGSEAGNGATVFDIGTTAYITGVDEPSDGRMNIATLGLHRFKIRQTLPSREPYLIALIEDYPFDESNREMIAQEASALGPILMKYLDLVAHISEGEVALEKMPDDASTLAFLTAIVLRAPMKDKQQLLSTASLETLLRDEKDILRREYQVLNLMSKSAPDWRNDDSPFSPN